MLGGLRIDRQNAVLDISFQNAQLNIKYTRPKMRTVRQPDARMDLEYDHQPELKVNWKKAHEANGIYTAMEGIDRATNKAYSETVQGMREIAQEGDMQMRSHDGRRVIPEIARKDMRKDIPSVNVKANAPGLTDMEWNVSDFKVDWSISPVKVEWENGKLEIDVDPYKVEIALSQKPMITIQYDPHMFASGIGRRLDVAI